MTMAPAARSRLTTSASSCVGPPCAPVPKAVMSPVTSVSSLMATGTPSSGRSSPPLTRAAAWSASIRARSGVDGPEGVELRVDPLDALEVDVDELPGGDLAASDELGLAVQAGEGEVGGVHGDQP